VRTDDVAALLWDGPDDAPTTILLAHGAGAGMESAAMTAIATTLARAGLRVGRFEFGYMAARRQGHQKPPPRAETLIPEYRAVVEAVGQRPRLVIGGKSMGGRVASMLADDLLAEGRIQGLLCLGYPFHPPGKPGELRTRHLEELRTPTLICQGTRDPFGSREEVGTYSLSPAIAVEWLEDGDHDLRPRKAVSGLTAADHLRRLAEVTKAWTAQL
jgi:predicted alpha/beta-hydrolase family hydrolase